ncbi:MAG: hypothetical protein ACRYFX_07360 [Janthinobacterium lividum]
MPATQPARAFNLTDLLSKWRAFLVPANYDAIDEATLLDLTEDIAASVASAYHVLLMDAAQALDEATDTSLPGFTPGWLYRLTNRATSDGDVVLFAISGRGLDEQNAWLVQLTPQQGGGNVETRTPVVYDLATDTTSPRSSVTQAQLVAITTRIPRTTTKTADYILVNSDFGCIVTFNSSSDRNLVLPEHTVAPLDLDGAVQIRNLGTGNVFVTFASGVTVISESGGYKVPPKAEAALHHVDLDTWFLNGGRS